VAADSYQRYLALQETHPEVAAEFAIGNFTVNKTGKKFSAISIDQAHEQLNALIKCDGGAVGLTENEAALGRWVIDDPEIMRMLQEFECDGISLDSRHHEQTPACQKKFKEDISNLLHVFDEENPFSESESNDLVSLDDHVLADPAVVKTVKTAWEHGKSQFIKYTEEQLQGSMSIPCPSSSK